MESGTDATASGTFFLFSAVGHILGETDTTISKVGQIPLFSIVKHFPYLVQWDRFHY